MADNKKLVSIVVRKRGVENTKKVRSIAGTLKNEGRSSIISDVSGSYTGTPIDGGVPEQDVDDL